ncbi:hypothetical protein D9757_014564 [Collybiopsis confluens]|uniref:Uncharacterized protein n=1 Tax=Collybiopsis confluens TaxID=2823264 RepID=A0A8H5CGY7_9AGAR|nr:hypothetical protein D9757_014564 [Collybiopsis confluens]
MNSSSSIRDLYSDPSSSWSFTAATQPNAPLNSAAAVSSPGPSTWKAAVRPPHNSIFDLSPDLNDVSVADINVVQVLRTVLASAMLQYASTAIAMPWEVGKLLLQVQYVPRDVQDSGVIQEVPEEDETSDSDGEDESYFADPGVPSTQRARHEIPRDGNLLMRNQQPTHDDDSRPEYIMPIEPQDGVWGMIKRIGRFRGEGWLALWKGLLTSCITEVLSSTLQPIIHSTLHSLFLPAAATLYQQNQPVLLLPIAVTSHLLTGLVLSP